MVMSAQSEQKQPPKKGSNNTSKPKDTASTSLSGCVDEAEGHYVLINDRTRAPIANLEAVGFETEGFAKHVGHLVTVRGTSNPEGDRPLFRVRSIQTIKESCEPPAPQ